MRRLFSIAMQGGFFPNCSIDSLSLSPYVMQERNTAELLICPLTVVVTCCEERDVLLI